MSFLLLRVQEPFRLGDIQLSLWEPSLSPPNLHVVCPQPMDNEALLVSDSKATIILSSRDIIFRSQFSRFSICPLMASLRLTLGSRQMAETKVEFIYSYFSKLQVVIFPYNVLRPCLRRRLRFFFPWQLCRVQVLDLLELRAISCRGF